MSEAYNELETIANELGLVCVFTFKPGDFADDAPVNTLTRNWTVKVERNGKEIISFPYFEGYAFCEAYPKKFGNLTVADANAIRRECQLGPRAKEPRQPLNALHNIAMDCIGVDDASGFEDWAQTYCYDPDSRKAYAVWEECNRFYHALKATVGIDNLRRIADVQL